MPSVDTQFKPGQSGNPNGRPKTKPFLDALRAEIDEAIEGDDKGALRMIARALINSALKGDNSAIAQIADRLDGKATQPIGTDPDYPFPDNGATAISASASLIAEALRTGAAPAPRKPRKG
jgi:hypothetical protein